MLRIDSVYMRTLSLMITLTSVLLISISFLLLFDNNNIFLDFEKEKEDIFTDNALNESRKNLLTPFGFVPSEYSKDKEYVLVLGANGLVGSALSERLERKGYSVLKVLSRHHRDLRIEGSLDIFNNLNIKFVYFLAYEVGGAKFLQLPEYQDLIIDSNTKIMNEVFDWILKHKIRFAFASSSLSADNSSYGLAKRIGENVTLSNPKYGRLFRLWNVFGFEFPSPRSHVIPDFIAQCIINNKVKAMTKGDELRQYTHVNDVSDALIALMEHFEDADQISDISDGNWISLKAVGKAIEEVIPTCKVEFSNRAAKVQKRHEPKLNTKWHQKWWKRSLNLTEGCREIYERMSNFYNETTHTTAVTIVINERKENETEFVKERINEIIKEYPMKVEFIVRHKNDEINGIIERSKGVSILFMDSYVIPTSEHLMFFQHRIPRDKMIYIANFTKADSLEKVKDSEMPSLAYFETHYTKENPKVYPTNTAFIAATKKTWIKVKGLPKNGESLHEWFFNNTNGYHTVKFQTPVWIIN